eukprot:6199500-Pleurochrysis_carterae.AAC.1
MPFSEFQLPKKKHPMTSEVCWSRLLGGALRCSRCGCGVPRRMGGRGVVRSWRRSANEAGEARIRFTFCATCVALPRACFAATTTKRCSQRKYPVRRLRNAVNGSIRCCIRGSCSEGHVCTFIRRSYLSISYLSTCDACINACVPRMRAYQEC